MSLALATPLITTEELLLLPEDGVDRDLILGQLRERPMTRRNRRHSRSTSRLASILESWLKKQKPPHGEVLSGEAGFRLRRNPDTTVGIDIAYITAELAAQNPDNAFLIEGAPVLAIEILSPSDQHEDLVEKIQAYLETGVRLVWIVDPDLQTVTVHRADAEPELFNVRQQLSGEPHLPGLQIPVAEIFGG